MDEFMMGTAEDDHNLEDFFPTAIPHHIQHIEYRIKLVIKTGTLFLPGETQVVNTSCLIQGKSHKKNLAREDTRLPFLVKGTVETK